MNSGVAEDINNAGQIVGNGVFNPLPSADKTYIYQFHTGIYTFIAGASSASAINSSGQVTGVTSAGGIYRYTAGVLEDLGTQGGVSNTAAGGINDSGVVVGGGNFV